MTENTNASCDNCQIKDKSMFGKLCAHSISKISQNKSDSQYSKGQILFHEGTRPLGVYCINGGKVKVYKLGVDGKEQIVKICTSGDLLGYKALLGEELYPVTAETIEEAKVCFIPKQDFLGTIESDNVFHQELLKSACKELGVMTENLTNLAQRSVRERFAIALLMLRDTYGIDSVSNGEVDINLTRDDLANIVGTATETLIRLLHDFKEEKLVETKGRKIKVINPEGLAKISNAF
jgi:CRP/FNR family transcriptional regulator, polysaccharide utilization system transcription regulator